MSIAVVVGVRPCRSPSPSSRTATHPTPIADRRSPPDLHIAHVTHSSVGSCRARRRHRFHGFIGVCSSSMPLDGRAARAVVRVASATSPERSRERTPSSTSPASRHRRQAVDRRAQAQDPRQPHERHRDAGGRAGGSRPAAVACSCRGSAIGYYGDRGDEVLTETSAPGRRLPRRGVPGVGGGHRGRRGRGHPRRPHPHRASCSAATGGALAKHAAAVPVRPRRTARLGTPVVELDLARRRGRRHPLPARPRRRSGPVNLTAPEPRHATPSSRRRWAACCTGRRCCRSRRSARAAARHASSPTELLFAQPARRARGAAEARLPLPPPGRRRSAPVRAERLTQLAATPSDSPDFTVTGGMRMPPSTRIVSAFM